MLLFWKKQEIKIASTQVFYISFIEIKYLAYPIFKLIHLKAKNQI